MIISQNFIISLSFYRGVRNIKFPTLSSNQNRPLPSCIHTFSEAENINFWQRKEVSTNKNRNGNFKNLSNSLFITRVYLHSNASWVTRLQTIASIKWDAWNFFLIRSNYFFFFYKNNVFYIQSSELNKSDAAILVKYCFNHRNITMTSWRIFIISWIT